MDENRMETRRQSSNLQPLAVNPCSSNTAAPLTKINRFNQTKLIKNANFPIIYSKQENVKTVILFPGITDAIKSKAFFSHVHRLAR
jgi:hypothetical protein